MLLNNNTMPIRSLLLCSLIVLAGCGHEINCTNGYLHFRLMNFTEAESKTLIINKYEPESNFATIYSSDTFTLDSPGYYKLVGKLDSNIRTNYIHYVSLNDNTTDLVEVVLPDAGNKFRMSNIVITPRHETYSSATTHCFNTEIRYTINNIPVSTKGSYEYMINLYKY